MELKVLLLAAIMAVTLLHMEVADGLPTNSDAPKRPTFTKLCLADDEECKKSLTNQQNQQEKKPVENYGQWEASAVIGNMHAKQLRELRTKYGVAI